VETSFRNRANGASASLPFASMKSSNWAGVRLSSVSGQSPRLTSTIFPERVMEPVSMRRLSGR